MAQRTPPDDHKQYEFESLKENRIEIGRQDTGDLNLLNGFTEVFSINLLRNRVEKDFTKR